MKKLTESDEFKDGLDLEGFVVKHPTFGIGTIVSNEGDVIQVKFQNNETKWLSASVANLTIVSKSEQEESISVSDKSEEYQANNKELEDRINELERNARLEEEKQRLAKRKRNDIVILIVIFGFFPFMFWIGAFGTCLDC